MSGPAGRAERDGAGGAGARPRDFSLVLSGGGARGLAHAGVLRALAGMGYAPAGIVGVSMGAVVGATYALNARWYAELVCMDVSGFPALPDFSRPGLRARLRDLRSARRAAVGMYFGWGVGQPAEVWGRGLLDGLTRGRRLEDGRVPVIAVATDLADGSRAALRTGPATDALYASAALAGILPPARIGDRLLIDGGYADIAPVDLARGIVAGPVIAVDASTTDYGGLPQNGLQSMMRAMEICMNTHAALRFGKADLVLRPEFGQPIGVLDFSQKRRAVAAGARAARRARTRIAALLEGPGAAAPSGPGLMDARHAIQGSDRKRRRGP